MAATGPGLGRPRPNRWKPPVLYGAGPLSPRCRQPASERASRARTATEALRFNTIARCSTSTGARLVAHAFAVAPWALYHAVSPAQQAIRVADQPQRRSSLAAAAALALTGPRVRL